MVEKLHPQQKPEHSHPVRSERIRPGRVHYHVRKHREQEAWRPNVLEGGVGGKGGGIGDAGDVDAAPAAEHDAHDRQPSHWTGHHRMRELHVAVAAENHETFSCLRDGDVADRAYLMSDQYPVAVGCSSHGSFGSNPGTPDVVPALTYRTKRDLIEYCIHHENTRFAADAVRNVAAECTAGGTADARQKFHTFGGSMHRASLDSPRRMPHHSLQ